jgi:phosphatidylethanolamine/phosphatidyl-N-methylethanolamine N-methyltransferase
MQESERTESRGKSAIDTQATRHTRRRYNQIAPVYDLMEGIAERGRYTEWRQRLWAKVEGPAVLELGVGTGKNIPYYPDHVHVTGIDLSENMLDRARQVAGQYPEKQVDLALMDAQRLQFPDGRFDTVVATFVFCSVPDPVLGLQEALRVTRPEGRLLLLEHMLAEPSALAWPMRGLDPLVHWMMGVHIARRTVDNVRASGWAVERVMPLSFGSIFRLIEGHRP